MILGWVTLRHLTLPDTTLQYSAIRKQIQYMSAFIPSLFACLHALHYMTICALHHARMSCLRLHDSTLFTIHRITFRFISSHAFLIIDRIHVRFHIRMDSRYVYTWFNIDLILELITHTHHTLVRISKNHPFVSQALMAVSPHAAFRQCWASRLFTWWNYFNHRTQSTQKRTRF